MKWFLLMPVAASVLYVVGAMFIKRAAQAGFDVWRSSTFLSVSTAIVFALLVPLCPLGDLPQPGPDWRQDWWQPSVAAVLFTVGQLLILLAFSRGDVSVATPALGSKSVFVAWFSTLVLQTTLPWQLWASACMSTVAIVFLNLGGASTVTRRQGETTVLALAAAAAFALFDVLVQKWSVAWGPGRFLPVLFGIAAVLSLGLIPLFPQAAVASSEISNSKSETGLRGGKSALFWMLGGALFFSLQLLLLMLSVARDAVSVNVVYSLRSLWGVGLVWLIGHWFDNQERHMPARLLGWRMAGAALMTAAIVLTVTRG